MRPRPITNASAPPPPSRIAATLSESAASRALIALAGLALAVAPASAMVGGAPLADQSLARHVVLIVGGQSLCSGVAIAPDLVLTAAHCVSNSGKYRLVVFEGRQPVVKEIASVAAHPQFSPRDTWVTYTTTVRGKVDVALTPVAALIGR